MSPQGREPVTAFNADQGDNKNITCKSFQKNSPPQQHTPGQQGWRQSSASGPKWDSDMDYALILDLMEYFCFAVKPTGFFGSMTFVFYDDEEDNENDKNEDQKGGVRGVQRRQKNEALEITVTIEKKTGKEVDAPERDSPPRPRVIVTLGGPPDGAASDGARGLVRVPYEQFLMVYSGRASAREVINMAMEKKVQVTGFAAFMKFGFSFEYNKPTWRAYYAAKAKAHLSDEEGVGQLQPFVHQRVCHQSQPFPQEATHASQPASQEDVDQSQPSFEGAANQLQPSAQGDARTNASLPLHAARNPQTTPAHPYFPRNTPISAEGTAGNSISKVETTSVMLCLGRKDDNEVLPRASAKEKGGVRRDGADRDGTGEASAKRVLFSSDRFRDMEAQRQRKEQLLELEQEQQPQELQLQRGDAHPSDVNTDGESDCDDDDDSNDEEDGGRQSSGGSGDGSGGSGGISGLGGGASRWVAGWIRRRFPGGGDRAPRDPLRSGDIGFRSTACLSRSPPLAPLKTQTLEGVFLPVWLGLGREVDLGRRPPDASSGRRSLRRTLQERKQKPLLSSAVVRVRSFKFNYGPAVLDRPLLASRRVNKHKSPAAAGVAVASDKGLFLLAMTEPGVLRPKWEASPSWQRGGGFVIGNYSSAACLGVTTAAAVGALIMLSCRGRGVGFDVGVGRGVDQLRRSLLLAPSLSRRV